MAAPQTIWGIDIGRSALKAVKLKLGSEGKVELLAHDYIEHPKILSQPDADRDELISEALEKLLSRNDLSKDGVFVSVPGQHTLARFTKLPPVAPKKIPDIVRYEAAQQIPFDMDEVIWDYQAFENDDLPDVEVGIFAMKRELIREHLLHFEQASIEPVGVQSSHLAVYNAAKFDGLLADDTTILLDIGAENTDLIIATQYSLWTRTFAIGGNSFTDALVKSFKLSFSKAENLKRTASSSKYARQVFQAMRPIFADLVQELQRSIGFYSSTHRDAEIEKVVGVGNAFKLPGLQKYLEQNLGLPVERPESYNNIVVPPDSDFNEELLSHAVAYGLAVQGLEQGQVTSNLLPSEIARQMVWAKKRPTFAAAAVCILIAGGLIWFRQSSDMSALLSGGAEQPRSVDLERAYQIIDNGPTTSLGPRAAAKEIRDAASEVSRELSGLTNSGIAETQERDSLIELHQNKVVVPKLLQFIHEAVPTPPGELGSASTQEDILNATASGLRGEREQLIIDSVNFRYSPDVHAEMDWDDYQNAQDMDDVVTSVEDVSELPGFMVVIDCHTPHRDGVKYLQESYIANLKKMGRKSGLGFYVNRVVLTAYSQTTRASLSSDPGRRGGFKSGGRGSSSIRQFKPVISEDFDEELAAMTDPVTGESILGDWHFTFSMDLILDEYPGGDEEEEGELVDEGEDG